MDHYHDNVSTRTAENELVQSQAIRRSKFVTQKRDDTLELSSAYTMGLWTRVVRAVRSSRSNPRVNAGVLFGKEEDIEEVPSTGRIESLHAHTLPRV
jgi:hypothetical protein